MDQGLDLAWEKGYRRVILETDVRQALNLINGENLMDYPLVNLVQRIRERINQDWEVVLKHCLRNANTEEDWLASTAMKVRSGRHELSYPSGELWRIIQNDCSIMEPASWASIV